MRNGKEVGIWGFQSVKTLKCENAEARGHEGGNILDCGG